MEKILIVLFYYQSGLFFVMQKFKDDPAGWITVLLLFLTFLVEILQYLKRIRVVLDIVRYSDGGVGYYVVATNTGIRKINLVEGGWKNWNGKIRDNKYSGVGFLCAEEATRMPLSDIKVNSECQHIVISPNLKDIYYVYVKDSTGRFYKKYAYFVLFSWLVRFFAIVSSKMKN